MQDHRPLVSHIRPVPIALRRVKDPRDMNTRELNDASQKKYGVKVSNSVDREKKPLAIKKLWGIMEKIDPGYKTAVDVGVVVLAGEAEGRPSLTDIDFTPWEKKLVESYCVIGPDGCEFEDDVANSKAVVFTMWNLLEAAYAIGRYEGSEEESKNRVKAMIESETEDGEEDGEGEGEDEGTVEEDDDEDEGSEEGEGEDESFDDEDFDDVE